MANVTAIESIESLLERQPAQVHDARIVEIFEESVTVRPIGQDSVRTNVPIPSHINRDDLSRGQAVRLGEHQGQPILLAVLDDFDEDANYSGLGYPIPHPPTVTVASRRAGWVVRWSAVSGANSYRVYRNDTADEVTPDELGYETERRLVVPYESPYVYFAVKAVIGLNESELSAWAAAPDPTQPTTFLALNDLQGHLLTIQTDDPAVQDPSVKCFEIEQALDASGTGAVSLGYVYLSDFPKLVVISPGVTRYYRIRSVNWGDVTGDWTDWDAATAGQANVQDKFDGYGGSQISSLESLWWLQIEQFEDASEWAAGGGEPNLSATDDTTDKVEGSQGVKFTDGDDTYYFFGGFRKISQWDFSNEERFTDDDYLCLTFTIHETIAGGNTFIGFISTRDNWPTVVDSFTSSAVTDPFPNDPGTYFKIIKRGDFATSGSPDWSDITKIWWHHHPAQATGAAVTLDDLRVVKADPDDPDTYNDTGDSWDKAVHTGSDVGEWHIYEGNRTGEPGKPYSYGQIKTAASPAVWYLSHKPLGIIDISAGSIQAGLYLKDSDGKAGLAFYISDVTADSWEMYAIEADSSANTIALVKWVGGTRTQIASASFTFDPDEILWLGADFSQYDSDAGRIKVYASLSEGNLIQAANLLLSEQDTAVGSGGSVGLLSYQANTRFVNFVAGSPAHAEVADVALALDGPILAGETRRVRYSRDDNKFEYSDDGSTFNDVSIPWTAVTDKPDNYPIPSGSSFPASPTEGDLFLLKVAPIFKAQLNGNPADSATSFTVDNVSTGAVTDTMIGHHIWLLDASGNRIAEGQISATGSGSTVYVTADSWATDGWLNDMWVEVGARHSLWHYLEGRWKCPLIDEVEVHWSGTDYSYNYNNSFADTGLEVNIIAPVACTLERFASFDGYSQASSDGLLGGTVTSLLDAGSTFPHMRNGAWVYRGSSTRHFSPSGAGLILDEVASGSHHVKTQWACWSNACTMECYTSTYPDYHEHLIKLRLSKL